MHNLQIQHDRMTSFFALIPMYNLLIFYFHQQIMLDLELHIHFKCKHYRSFFPIIFQLDSKIHYQFLRNHFVPEL